MCDLHHDKELNGVHCLPDVAAPSFNIVGMDELRKLHTHVTQEHEIGQVSEQYYTAHLSTSSGASMEDLHPLHYPPILPQDTLFLSTDLQDVDEFVVAENSGLPFEASSLSCLGAPEACLMHQKSHSQEDRHRIVHDPCNQHASAKQQSHVSSSVHVDDDIPTKWSWFNGQCSIKEEPCKGTPSSLLYADQLKGGTFPSSKKLKGMDSTCTKPPLEPIMKWWAQKRRRPENDPLVMLEDCHDAKGDHDDGNRLSPNGQTCRSKHLMTERRRRLKLNERLYSLRALVPTITKMDKVSIVGDAIKYVRDLQAQLESTQADVLALQAGNYYPTRAELFNSEMEGNDAQCMQFDILQHKMLEMHVSNVEPNIHCLRIICERGKGVLVQLVEALEALDVEIVSASLTSVSDRVLNMIVIKADEVLNSEDLKDMLIRSFLTYGLSL